MRQVGKEEEGEEVWMWSLEEGHANFYFQKVIFVRVNNPNRPKKESKNFPTSQALHFHSSEPTSLSGISDNVLEISCVHTGISVCVCITLNR